MTARVRNDHYRARRVSIITASTLCLAFLLSPYISSTQAIHHMERRAPRKLVTRDSADSTPLHVTNMCPDDIYPGINTQSGDGPPENGFRLAPGETIELTVSENWQGRVWGRTNCSFNEDGTKPFNGSPGKACGSGDCNGVLDCKVGGDIPVSLAEFTLDAGDGQTYYDISLVDGYNIPMAIQVEPHGNSSLDDLPPNLTNPTCTGTVGLLAPQDWMPYADGQTFLGTNSSFPLPLDSKIDDEQVANWCPWDLQVNKPQPPDDGIYMYPDNSVQRPAFNPCYSACAKWSLAADCCTGDHNSPSTCQPSQYSKNVKGVCPDAYSYGESTSANTTYFWS
jgi:beta-mannosidase